MSVYRIVFENDDGQNMMTNESWVAAIGVMNSMISGLDYTVINGFTSPFVLNGDILQFEEVETALVFKLKFINWILTLLLVL